MQSHPTLRLDTNSASRLIINNLERNTQTQTHIHSQVHIDNQFRPIPQPQLSTQALNPLLRPHPYNYAPYPLHTDSPSPTNTTKEVDSPVKIEPYTGLLLKTQWKVHSSAICSITYNSARNQFVSASSKELAIWDNPECEIQHIQFPVEVTTADLNPWQECSLAGGLSRKQTVIFVRCGVKDNKWCLVDKIEKKSSRRIRGIIALYEGDCMMMENYFITGEVEVETNAGTMCQYDGSARYFNNPVHKWDLQATPQTLQKYKNDENLFFASTLSATVTMYDIRSPNKTMDFGKANNLGKTTVGSIVTCMDTISNSLFTAGMDNSLRIYDVRNPNSVVQSTPVGSTPQCLLIRNEKYAVLSTARELFVVDVDESDTRKRLAPLANLQNTKYQTMLFHPTAYLLFCGSDISGILDVYEYNFEEAFENI